MDPTTEHSIATDEQNQTESPNVIPCQSDFVDTEIMANNTQAIEATFNTIDVGEQSIIELLSDSESVDEEKSSLDCPSNKECSSAVDVQMEKYEPIDIDEILENIHGGNASEHGNDEPMNVLDDFINERASELDNERASESSAIGDIQVDGKYGLSPIISHFSYLK